MKLLLFLLIFKFNQTYFNAIYSIEKLPFDSAIIPIYDTIKKYPDSTLCDIAINYSKGKLTNMDLNEFVEQLYHIKKGIPYIDSIFTVYLRHYHVYDTLFYNYLSISFYVKNDREIKKELFRWYKRFSHRPELLDIILIYALKHNQKKLIKVILSRKDFRLKNLSTESLFLLAKYFSDRNDYKTIGPIFEVLSQRPLKGKLRLQFLKIKGLYFYLMNRPDSALYYLTQYVEYNGDMDMNLFKILISLYIENGYYKNAKDVILTLLKQSPFDYNLRKQLGYVYFMLEKYDSSLINYFIAESLSENDPEIHYYIARVFVRKEYYNDALRSINRAIKIQNTYSYALLKAYILYKQNKLNAAARELLAWKKKGKDDPYYLYLVGTILKDMGRRKLAFLYLKTSILKDPTHPTRYIPLIPLFDVSRDTSFFKMVVDTVKKLKIDDDDEYLFGFAYVAGAVGYIELEDSIYRMLIKKYPKRPMLYNNLGYLYLKHGNIDTAEKYIKKAYELSPKNPYIVDSYGWLLFKKGEIEKAYMLIKYAYKHSHDMEIKEHYRIVKNAYKKRKKKK